MVGALLIPVCADWAKRGASGSARERDRAIHPRRTGARRRHRRADRSRRQILEMRSPLTRHAAAPADESTRRIEERERKKDIHPRCGEFTPGWIIRSRWRSIGVRGGEDGERSAKEDRTRNNPILNVPAILDIPNTVNRVLSRGIIRG